MTESQNITSKDIGGGSGSSNPSPRSQPSATGSGGTPADRATNPSSNAESGSPPLIVPSTGTDQNVTDTQSALGYQHYATTAVHGTHTASSLSSDPQQVSNSRRVTTETAAESLPDFVDTNVTLRPSQIHGARSTNTLTDDTMSELSAATKFTALSQSNENQSAVDSLKNAFNRLEAALATLTDQYTYAMERARAALALDRKKVNNYSTEAQSQSQAQSNLQMPEPINLETSGLRRSTRTTAGQSEAKVGSEEYNKQYGGKYGRPVNFLFAMFCLLTTAFVSTMQLQPRSRCTASRSMKFFEQVNTHFDDTINGIHTMAYAFAADVGHNDIFTYKQMLEQVNVSKFLEAMEEEIEVHTRRGSLGVNAQIRLASRREWQESSYYYVYTDSSVGNAPPPPPPPPPPHTHTPQIIIQSGSLYSILMHDFNQSRVVALCGCVHYNAQ